MIKWLKKNWKRALLAAAVGFVVAVTFALLDEHGPRVISVADPKEALYTIDGQSTGIYGTTRYFGNEATGDLNGDGLTDEAFLITQQPGGSGTFYYVVVALRTSKGWVGTNGVLLGDRIAPQTTQIKNGELIVNYADRRPGEPFTTQPSVGKSMYLKVVGGELVQVSK